MKLTQVLVVASGLSLSVVSFAGNQPVQNNTKMINIPNQINSSNDKKSNSVDFVGTKKSLKANGQPVSVNGKPVKANNVTIKTDRAFPAQQPVKP